METSTTSNIISSLGGGSGVDMVALAGNLAEARFLSQVGQLTSRSDRLEAKISAASTLKNQITSLASALGDRIRNGDLAPSATIANGAVAQVSVLSGSSGKGSYSLEVTQLAAAQTLAGKSYTASSDLVGEGQLTIRLGSITGSSFTANGAATPIVIDVTATDTLATVADKIRTSGSGLNAYVANTPTGAKLVVKGVDGAENAFVIEASGASAAGSPAPGAIDYLAWDPSTDTGELKASATDAAFLFDGVAMTGTSNKITGLPGGLVLGLTGTNIGAPTQISFAEKSKQISTMMGDLVAALNDITSTLGEVAAPLGGELGNDAGARALKRALADLSTREIMPNAAPGEPRTLGDLGLVFGREGTFRLDGERLQAALTNDLAGAGAMFTTGLFGVFATVDNMARTLSSSTDPGSLGGSVARYTGQLGKIEERLADISEQQDRLREQLVKEFTWADRTVTASQSTLNFIKSQIAVWNASDN